MVLAGAGRRSWHIVGEVGWCQDFVDDVDHAVAGVDVGGGHGGVVDHHAVTNGERQRLSVEGVGGHAVRKRCGWDVSSDDVVLKNVGQGSHAIGGVQGFQVDSGLREGLVGWREHRERPVALKCFEQAGLNHGGNQRVVGPGALGGPWDVVGCGRGLKHLVDNVDDAVARRHISHADVGVVDHHAASHREGQWLAVDRRGTHAF